MFWTATVRLTAERGILRRKPGLNGFTLVEIMILLAVITILAAVALPSYRSFVMAARVRNATSDAVSSLLLARNEAIKRNALVNVIPNGGNWENGWTITAGNAILRQQPGLDNNLKTICYAGAVAVPCLTVSYAGSGRLASASQSILVTINEAASSAVVSTRCIALDPSGLPRSMKGACS